MNAPGVAASAGMKTPENKNIKQKLPDVPRKKNLNLTNDSVFSTISRLEFSPFYKEKIEETR